MTVPVLEMPEEAAELAKWLEHQLVSDALGHLVAELSVVHSPDEPHLQTLDDVLETHSSQVLKSGLGVLPVSSLRALVRQPWLLLDLQQRVFFEGGNYWRVLPSTPSVDQAVERLWMRFEQQLGANVASSVKTVSRRQFAIWMSSAAALIVGFLARGFLAPPGPRPGVAWGWQKPAVFALAGRERAKYLNDLADSAHEWFNDRPDSSVALATRILEFRRGCSGLFLSEKDLPASDRAWLLERCRAWSAKLDGHLAALESGTDVSTVQAAADQTINTLIEKLRERATTPV